MTQRKRAALRLATAASLGLSLGIGNTSAAEVSPLSATTNRVSRQVKESQQLKVDSSSGISRQVKLSSQSKLSSQGKLSDQHKISDQLKLKKVQQAK